MMPIRVNKQEAGYMLLAVVVLSAMVLIGLSVAAPVLARDIRRTRERECQQRADQYVRAVRLYYRKFGRYPPSMEALQGTNGVRFLRQLYVDPLTGKSDWRIIHQPKTTIHGFFGEELGGMPPGLGSAAGSVSNLEMTSQGSTAALSAGFAGSLAPSTPSAGTQPPDGGSVSGTSSSSSLTNGSPGLILGVGTSKTGDSLTEPNLQKTYDTWEFFYDPRIERLYASSNLMGGGTGTSNASSGFGAQTNPIGTGTAGGPSTGISPVTQTPSRPDLGVNQSPIH